MWNDLNSAAHARMRLFPAHNSALEKVTSDDGSSRSLFQLKLAGLIVFHLWTALTRQRDHERGWSTKKYQMATVVGGQLVAWMENTRLASHLPIATWMADMTSIFDRTDFDIQVFGVVQTMGVVEISFKQLNLPSVY